MQGVGDSAASHPPSAPVKDPPIPKELLMAMAKLQQKFTQKSSQVDEGEDTRRATQLGAAGVLRTRALPAMIQAISIVCHHAQVW